MTECSRTAADQKHWKSHRERIGKLNAVASVLPEMSMPPPKKRVKKTAVRSLLHILSQIHVIFIMTGSGTSAQSFRGSSGHPTSRYYHPGFLSITLFYFKTEHTQIQDDLLSVLSAHLDLYHTFVTLEHHQCIREVITLHALDHVTK